jgi:hypothetical protein
MKAFCQTKYEGLMKSTNVLIFWNNMIFSDICNFHATRQNDPSYHILCNSYKVKTR